MSAAMDLSVFDQVGLGLFRYQIAPKGKAAFVYSNKALLKMFGFASFKQIQQESLENLIIDKKDFDKLVQQLKKEGKVEFFRTTAKTRKNKVLWLAINAQMVKNSTQKFIEGVIQDIAPLEASDIVPWYESDALQTILDSIPDAIYFKDHKNRITRVNKFYAQGFGGKLDKIIGKTDFDFFPPEQAKGMFDDDNLILKTGKPIVGKIEKTLLQNGTWNQVITTKVPMFDSAGKVAGTMGITRDMTAHANLEKQRYSMALKALMVLGRALEMRDPYTQSHARDVGCISEAIARELKFDEDRIEGLKIAAELHDLGKIGVPLDILIKPGKLSDLEYRLIKEHTTNCYNLIKDIEFPYPLAEIVYQHHERLDGSGYPRKLKGKEIVLEARILAVSDVLESMTHHRPYRAALGIKKAIEELRDGMGIKYDKEIVSIALKLIRKNNGSPFWNNSHW